MGFSLIRSLAKFTVKHIGDGLTGGTIPIGSIAVDVFEEWCKSIAVPGGPVPASPPPAAQLQIRTELEKIAQDSRAYRKQVEAILVEMKASEEVSARALVYLNQVPGRIQTSMRRPDDPTGRTIPVGIVLRKAEDLRPFLPDKMPRFQTGDLAVPGTDLVVQELLGVGGFGEVWKAVHKERPHAPPVALKFCTDEGAARSLRKEIELLDRVATKGRHKGIVELKYVHLSGSTPCLEYEFVSGGDLASLIADLHRAGKASPVKMAKIVCMLAQAVGHAHRLKPPIVHRDLKPQNVLTTRVDGKLQLKVADFGIGGIVSDQAIQGWKVETARAGPGTLTQSAGACTPLYASPQQRRFGPPDPRDDVYALGVIWFQMLSGDLSKEPPRGGSWKKKFAEQGAATEMIALLERCIEDDPAERPADAAVLAEELGLHLQAASAPVVVLAEAPVAQAASVTMLSPSQPAAEQWYYTRDGQRVGPVSLEELRELAVAGTVGRKDMVWTAKLSEWSAAGSIQGLCPERPPAPPPLPRVVGRVVVEGRFYAGMMPFKIKLDNKMLGESRGGKGCDFPFETTTGKHVLELAFRPAPISAFKTTSYKIKFREGGNYRITLQLNAGFFSPPSFAEDVQIQKISEEA